MDAILFKMHSSLLFQNRTGVEKMDVFGVVGEMGGKAADPSLGLLHLHL